MRLYSIITGVCVVVAVASISLAYILAGYWLILPVFFGMALFWLLQKRWSVFWTVSSLLVVYVVLAVIGIVLNLSVFLLVAGCAATLACWDLATFGDSIPDNQPLESRVPLEKYHLQSLAIATAVGLLLIFIGSSVSLRLPFVAIVFLVLFAVGGLTYVLRLKAKDL
jgi:hypothetical protein